MTNARKVCVVTGTRAEYGLLYWLMQEIAGDSGLELQLVVTGAHLSPEFGSTYRVIEADGFRIDAKVEMLLSSDTAVGSTKSLGLAVIGFADAFERLRPDVVVLLGDRIEVLAAAQAAMVARIPIAHIHGGELTEGVIDEAIRHAVTKMSHLHFTAAEEYRDRVLQLGEAPERVYNTGAVGLDNLSRLQLLTRAELEESLGFALGPGPVLLCTHHPETLSGESPAAAMAEIFRALDRIPGARVVITKANADAGGREINRAIDEYAAARPGRVAAFTSLGQLRYLSLLRAADVVVGNSSSGIIEAPAAGTATVNIGERQRGRLAAPSVITCGGTEAEIVAAIERALTPEFRAVAAEGVTHFGRGGASAAIKRVLKEAPLDAILRKTFHDLRGPAAVVRA